MPRKKTPGTFEGAPAYRWTRMVRGVRWRLLCRPKMLGEDKPNTGWLGLPEAQWTKEDSWAAANAWWETNAIRAVELPVGAFELMAKAEQFKNVAATLGVSLEAPEAKNLWEVLPAIPKVASNKGIAHWQKEFLDLKKSDGQRRSGRYDNLKRSVDRFCASLGDGAPVAAVTEENYRKFYSSIMKAGHSDYFTRDTVRDVKTFVNFLWQNRAIKEELRNLDSLKVRVVDREQKHFSANELRALLTKADGHLKLFVFLFANCGMRQKDVSSITHAMYKDGYITRKRGKTINTTPNAPKVSHKLWPETIELIEQFRTKGKGDDLLFVQENGKPWVLDDELNENDRRKRDDNFTGLWRDFIATNPQPHAAKFIRGSAANLLNPSGAIQTNQLSLQVKFLADVPSGVVLKHYIDPTQPELDTAVNALRVLILGKKKKAS
ncbi:hypothetical protein ETAA8_09550 [Anatilimnocola aggregata]|uniref:Core-binding (CB) domain-containing protein n=1 Tax=Anatilimnocola aggregata TaxID=2528021 RepID=A0A517Y6M0_9BACT|nr:hypothetical protein [Anatilimnocola aggregata]QDU25883.1 hypothetical protein ETAA8_09550 [Anatilimnocola aggregata]